MPICSMPVVLGHSQPGLVILVFQNEVSSASEEEKMELEVVFIFKSQCVLITL